MQNRESVFLLDNPGADETPAEVRSMLNTLLYMAGDDNIVQRVGHSYPDKPFKRHQRGPASRSERYEDIFSDPSEADVGVRLRSALMRYAEKREQAEEGDKKEGPIPHIRRMHPHLYWTGEGRTVPIVKYIGPILVGGDDGEETDLTPAAQKVR